jgi:hypothetical protein
MVKIADVYQNRNGIKRVEFFQLGIYSLVKNTLDFRFAVINKKGYFLKFEDGIYKKTYFESVKRSFTDYIRSNFNDLEINGEISFSDFIEEYYKKIPVKKGSFITEYLSEDFELTASAKHLILLEIDAKYSNQHRNNEMIGFLKENNFVETADKMGLSKKDVPLYYKRVGYDKFLIFTIPYQIKKTNQWTFDFLKVKAKSEFEFLKRRNSNSRNIQLGFDLIRDHEMYQCEL